MNTQKTKLKKYLLRLIAMLALPILLYVPIYYMQHFLCIPPTTDLARVLQFEKEADNSIDVIMLGSSPTYSGFSSAYAYNKFGFTSYPYAIGGASCNMWKPAMMNILRTQTPKLVVVDVFGGGYEIDTLLNRKAAIYMISETMPLSAEKIEMAREASNNVDSGNVLSITFPIIRYHANMATNLKKIKRRLEIERSGPPLMNGVEVITRVKKQKLIPQEIFTDESIPLDAKTEKMINSFIDYCESNNIAILFVKYPCTPKYDSDFEANRRQNSVLKLAEKRGCPTLDLQRRFYEVGFDEKTDFYDRSHVNVKGQKKLTEYVGSYIRNAMGIGPSKLDKSVKDEWDTAVNYYNAYYAMSEDLLKKGEVKTLAESPKLIRDLEQYMNKHK